MPTIVDQLIMHEGLQEMPYSDTTGHLTIGVGRNLTDHGISRDEALYLLNHDIADATQDCANAFGFWDSLDGIRQRVLIDMCFNMGIETLKEFQQTLGAIAAGQYGRASQLMLDSKWAGQVGHRAIRLSEMMRTGQDYDY